MKSVRSNVLVFILCLGFVPPAVSAEVFGVARVIKGDRWELLADNGVNAIPEPTTAFLFSAGLAGAYLRRRLC